MTTEATASQPSQQDPIVATAGGYYRRTRYIMCVVLIAAGCWFAYDGWVGWPEENRKHAEIRAQLEEATRNKEEERAAQLAVDLREYKEHSDRDIMIQKVLAVALPPLGIALLGWALYNSRGQYRLEGTTLSVPGHPPIHLDDITKIDKQLWDRKGIAYIEYESGSQTGRIRLDDFVYDAHPTRDIFKRVEAHTLARLDQSAEPAEAPTHTPNDRVGTPNQD